MSDLMQAQHRHKRWQVLNRFEHLVGTTQQVLTSKGLPLVCRVDMDAHGFLVIDAVHLQRCVGTMHLDPDGDGQGHWSVHLIETHPGAVRQGVASALYAYAQQLVGPIAHSRCRSSHGDAWAKAVGGQVPAAPITTMVDYEDFPLWLSAWMADESTDVIDAYFPED